MMSITARSICASALYTIQNFPPPFVDPRSTTCKYALPGYPQLPLGNLMRISNQTLFKYLHKLTLYLENV